MDNSKIFRNELAIQYPDLGRALWQPDPMGDTAVQVGDVGVIRRGCFNRLINALSPRDAPSGPSESDPHYPHYLQRLPSRASSRISRGTDYRQSFCSKNVTNASREDNVDASR
jgi:hypothetical protein